LEAVLPNYWQELLLPDQSAIGKLEPKYAFEFGGQRPTTILDGEGFDVGAASEIESRDCRSLSFVANERGKAISEVCDVEYFPTDCKLMTRRRTSVTATKRSAYLTMTPTTRPSPLRLLSPKPTMK
jgi:hypothetical protein